MWCNGNDDFKIPHGITYTSCYFPESVSYKGYGAFDTLSSLFTLASSGCNMYSKISCNSLSSSENISFERGTVRNISANVFSEVRVLSDYVKTILYVFIKSCNIGNCVF